MVCTSKVVSPEQRKDYEAWLTEGKTLIDAVLKDKDCQAGLSVPAGRRPLPEGRFSWVHFPAAGGEAKPVRRGLKKSQPDSPENDRESLEHVRHSGAPNCETVAVVFQRQDDMERWTHSNRRAEWLKRGERFNGGDPDGALRARANVIMDDGSLGGWLPANQPTGDSNQAQAVPSWKVYAAVVLAQYPIYELNMLLLLPGLEAAGESAAWFTGATQPARGAVVQAWSSAMAVFGTLPLTQRLLRWYGFMGAKGVDGGRDRVWHSRDSGDGCRFGRRILPRAAAHKRNRRGYIRRRLISASQWGLVEVGQSSKVAPGNRALNSSPEKCVCLQKFLACIDARRQDPPTPPHCSDRCETLRGRS